MTGTGSFPRIFKLTKATEFQSVYSRGAKKTSRSFVVFVLANERDYSRFGLTTPRRLGAAYKRNRIKRRVREILRLDRLILPKGFDIVVNPRGSVYERNFDELRLELQSLLGVSV